MLYKFNPGSENEQTVDLAQLEVVRRETEVVNDHTLYNIVLWFKSGKEVRMSFDDITFRDTEYTNLTNAWDEVIDPWGRRVGQA